MNNIKFLPSLNKPELYNEQMNSISSATEKNLLHYNPFIPCLKHELQQLMILFI